MSYEELLKAYFAFKFNSKYISINCNAIHTEIKITAPNFDL
ncbi:MAG: hypothetical protein ACI4VF_08040 [Lachnospirales bacterium]